MAIYNYESVMKTEPNVPYYANKAKERICFCLVKKKMTAKAIYICSEAHQRDPRNINILRETELRPSSSTGTTKKECQQRGNDPCVQAAGKKWHPDKYRKDWEERKAGKRFIDITSAKEVLTDPEMRKKFDSEV
ncbi:dnaJ homolog subfamily C member 3-like [Salvelinus namaycush]|uniref:DnaJ homolog subfamily C member 3-like n=1 Tax=Salvelinus namaycush TaxID=8040 RepID=A0A8U0TN00_SALNM|nr:dnaJ homolog subfamily C member 3-like [Salvelinus namaycush]